MTKINKEKESLLSQELLMGLLRYERETGLFYWIKKPTPTSNNIKAGQVAGTRHHSGYTYVVIGGYHYAAHRLAWLYVYGNFPEGLQPFIDHINGKKDDNRVENLRTSSQSVNCKNAQMYSNNTSGITGVFRHEKTLPSGKLYEAWIAIWNDENGRRRTKTFSIKSLGEEITKQKTVDYRAEQLRLLELNHGIIYSDRHGV